MTHGEAWLRNKERLDPKAPESLDKGLPPRMSRKEARAYYNTKLFKYWLKQLPRRYPIEIKKKMLRYLMFKNGKVSLNEVI